MKSLSAILLLFMLGLSLSLRMVVILTWQINQNYIAQNLCENRADARSCCKGKCQLRKQLSKIDTDTDSKHEGNLKLSKITALDVFDLFDTALRFNSKGTPSSILHRLSAPQHYQFSFYTKLFRPPASLI